MVPIVRRWPAQPIGSSGLRRTLRARMDQKMLASRLDAGEAAFDHAAYGNLCEAIGRETVHRLLCRFADQLGEFLDERLLVYTDRNVLRRRAHALVSASGVLGFKGLSGLCREIENACESGTDLESLLAEFKVAGRGAMNEIVTLTQAA
jgi:HPt (histidine-containing phosphotransfer) domain-containing protein